LKFALAQQEDQSMKRSRFSAEEIISEEQIIGRLKEHEAGISFTSTFQRPADGHSAIHGADRWLCCANAHRSREPSAGGLAGYHRYGTNEASCWTVH
jgi:hypothetical protein